MAEDMIERAARATFLVGRDWDDPASFDAAPDYGKDVHRDYARAALLAALDPEDEALIEAVAQKLDMRIDDMPESRALAQRALIALKAAAQGERGGA